MTVPSAMRRPREARVEPTVGDLAVHHPPVLPADADVRAVRAAFDDDHIHMVLLTSGHRLVGTLVRDDLGTTPGDDEPALPLARLTGRTVAADVPAEQARRWLLARGRRRLAVVDEDGALQGLLCLKRKLTGFCSDADVAERAAEAAGRFEGPSSGACVPSDRRASAALSTTEPRRSTSGMPA